MGSIGLALLGILIGAGGAEILRGKRPDLVKKTEESAKRFVDRFMSKKSD
ncbi:hypothetical protein ACFL1X_02375 [Candidatus Hydrogenedentota bacterium]